MKKEYHIDKIFKSRWGKKILDWYSINKRDLPWRRKENQNFYRVWISEIMLQQTQVSVVIPYYNKFILKWPTLESFYNAKLEEILFLWQGMGYYKRAENLYKAKELLKTKKKITVNYQSLLEIPGIGDYTSSAISAILNDERCTVIDGNIKRILTRVFKLNNSDNSYDKNIRSISNYLTPERKNGNYCQSLMDLANSVCKVRNPDCKICPVEDFCLSKGPKLILKKRKTNKNKIAVAFIINYRNYFLVEKSSKKLLKNLYCFPLSDSKYIDKRFIESEFLDKTVNHWLKIKKLKVSYKLAGNIIHKFSHFQLKVLVVKLELKSKFRLENFFWLTIKELNDKPVSKLMLKIKEKMK